MGSINSGKVNSCPFLDLVDGLYGTHRSSRCSSFSFDDRVEAAKAESARPRTGQSRMTQTTSISKVANGAEKRAEIIFGIKERRKPSYRN